MKATFIRGYVKPLGGRDRYPILIILLISDI